MKRVIDGVRFQSILCPVDFSDHSREALRYATELAARSGGRLTVLFVNDPLLLAAAAAAFHRRRQFLEQTRTDLVRFVNNVTRDRRRPSLPIVCQVSSGNPGAEILRAAKQLGSDLIVIGTHGLSAADKLFFGSTTEHVLRQVTIPVLAVPPRVRRQKAEARAQLLRVKRVIAPIDLTTEWEGDARWAADIAESLRAELMLVHVLRAVDVPRWLRRHWAGQDRHRIVKARTVLERVRTKLFSGSPSTSTVAIGDPADEIAHVVANGPPALVVMALRGGRGLWRARRGSIAYRVLTRAATPVLALPRKHMRRYLSTTLLTAATRALSERDRIEMAGIDALLSPLKAPQSSARRR